MQHIIDTAWFTRPIYVEFISITSGKLERLFELFDSTNIESNFNKCKYITEILDIVLIYFDF